MAARGFRRQRLLDVRKIVLQIEAVELKEREDAHLRQRIELARALQIKQAELETGTAAESGAVVTGPREFMLRTWRIMELNGKIEDKLSTSRKTADKVEQQRLVVEEAAKSKQTLERLKEHQDEAARFERDRLDQKAIDEVAARKYLDSSHGRAIG